jgi:hypothetical protein
LASTPYREALGARLVNLRDFLLLFFFIDLGAHLDLSVLGAQVTAAVVFSLFVLIGNPLIVMIIMGALGYGKRTGFMAGLTVAQISEFSLILGALGLSLGHIDRETMGLITLVGLITISASTYMILYAHPLYAWLSPWLGLFERKTADRERLQGWSDADAGADIILFGVGRYGSALAQTLQSRGCRVVSIDNDPLLVDAETGSRIQYGDAEDSAFIRSLPLAGVQWVVSTLRDEPINLSLLQLLRSLGYSGRIALSAEDRNAAGRLQQAGADLLLVPYLDASSQAADRLLENSETQRDNAKNGLSDVPS